MTDEQMDARLRAAGERWREGVDGDTLIGDAGDGEHDEVLALAPTRRRRRPWFVAVAAAAAVVLIAGLTFALRSQVSPSQPNAERAGLQGSVWLLRSVNGVGANAAALYIGPDGTLVADDECRLIGGHASISGDRLSVTGLSVRYKGCTDQYGTAFYDRGTNVLRGPATFSIGSSGLTITRKHVGALQFVPAPSTVPPPSLDVPTLTDTTWRAPDGKTLRIDTQTGAISGPLCSGKATVSGPTVTFTGCRAPIGQGTYLAAISGATLTLTAQGIDPGFSGMSSELTFVWQPADGSIDPASLTGRAWSLVAVAGQSVSTGSLSFDNGVAQLDFGCGAFRVSARVERGTFTIDHFAPPLNSCAARASTTASMLSQQPAAWVVRGDKLIVYGGGSQTFALVYEVAKPQSSTLQGDWTLANVFNGSGAPGPKYATAMLNIASNGTVTGTDGCRTFTGTVSTSGSTATFSLTMPEPACSPNVEQTAGLVDRMLSGPVSFTVGSGVLVLSNNEIGRLSFTGKPSGGPNPQLLTAHDWQITTITYGSGHFRNGAPSQDNGFLNFRTQSFSVQHTCSIENGQAQLLSGVMTLHPFDSKAHSCPPPINNPYRSQSEQAITLILAGTVQWSVDGSVLTLSSDRGMLRAIGGIRSDLTSATWRLTGTARGATETTAVGSVVLSFPTGTQIQLVRCYTSGGNVYVGDSSFSVANFRTTVALPCPSGPPGTQQQNDFLDRLLSGGEVTWSIVGDTLTLSRDGAGQAIFVRAH